MRRLYAIGGLLSRNVGSWAWLLGVCAVFAPQMSIAAAAASKSSAQARIETRLRIAPPNRPVQILDLPAAMSALRIPSASVAVIERGRIAWSRTFGDAALGTPVYQAASLSKFVTAIVAMRLVDKGVLALDAPVGDSIKIWSPGRSSLMDGHPVTLRWLLSMRGGINVPGFAGYPADATLPTLQQILQGAPPASSPEVKVEAQPGSRYAYSGGGYEIVEALTEGAAGKPFADVARDEVFGPLGLSHSAFGARPPASLATDTVQEGHDGDGKALPGGWRAVPELAAAGLWSTPEDIARVLIEVCNQRAGRGAPFLSPATVAQILTPQGGGPYGLGAAIAQSGRHVVLMKRGQNVGYQGYLLLFPNACNGIVIMTGSDNGTTLAEALIRRAAEVYRWPSIGKLQD